MTAGHTAFVRPHNARPAMPVVSRSAVACKTDNGRQPIDAARRTEAAVVSKLAAELYYHMQPLLLEPCRQLAPGTLARRWHHHREDDDEPLDRARAALARTEIETGISIEEIFGVRRTRAVVLARQSATCRVAYLCPSWSMTRLGRFFDRDHTTIVHTLRKGGMLPRDSRAVYV